MTNKWMKIILKEMYLFTILVRIKNYLLTFYESSPLTNCFFNFQQVQCICCKQ